MSTLTMDMIRDMQQRVAQLARDTKPSLDGMRVNVTPVRIGPARVHSKRCNGGKASYHRRVQKKWNRRFGMADRTMIKRGECYVLRNSPFVPDTLVVRADDWPQIRATLTRV